MKSPRKYRLIRIALLSLSAIVLLIALCSAWLLIAARGRILADASGVSRCDIALVLGTSSRVGKFANPFFEGRMDAAAALWHAGKVKHFLLSGDNSEKYYDEPTAMKSALLSRGLPENAMTLDYAGFRTLDSLVRAREVFGVSRLIVVSDGWHLPRALFLAGSAGLDATGFSSAEVPWKWSARTRIREWISRVKAVADVFILQTKPKFLGERVTLPAPR